MAGNDGQGRKYGLLSRIDAKCLVWLRQFMVDFLPVFLEVELATVVVVVTWRSSRSKILRESTLIMGTSSKAVTRRRRGRGR